MLRHKRVWLTAGFAASLFAAGEGAAMVKQRAICHFLKLPLAAALQAAASAGSSIYEIRAVHDPDGIAWEAYVPS